MGAFVLGIGMFAVVVDVMLQPKHRKPRGEQNPWNAGTLEWISEPEENWGVRSIPRHREPLSAVGPEGSRCARSTHGAWYLPDAKEGRRETLVTSVLDAEPVQCLRVGGTVLRHDRLRP